MWKSPSALHPTILATKMFMVAQRRLRNIALFIDLHGHTRKPNVFMYGCGSTRKSKALAVAFPKYLSMHRSARKFIYFPDCSFQVKKSRESTARVVVCKELGVLRRLTIFSSDYLEIYFSVFRLNLRICSYTLEATFSGANYGELKQCHMNIGHLQSVGSTLCEALAQFASNENFAREFGLMSDSLSSFVGECGLTPSGDLLDETIYDREDADDLSSGSEDEGGDNIVVPSVVFPTDSSDSLDSLMNFTLSHDTLHNASVNREVKAGRLAHSKRIATKSGLHSSKRGLSKQKSLESEIHASTSADAALRKVNRLLIAQQRRKMK